MSAARDNAWETGKIMKHTKSRTPLFVVPCTKSLPSWTRGRPDYNPLWRS